MANELELKYGCNPNQKPARIFIKEGELPIEVLNGRPGYINLLDAFNSWQLVKELKEATGLPAAASFKHVSPAGAAVAVEMSDTLKKMYFVEDIELSPLACAYARARGADRLCSYGDWAALSDVCDADVARYLAKEVSDGIIAPGYTDEALEILKTKRKGSYNVVQIDPDYVPAETELKDVFGITFSHEGTALKDAGEVYLCGTAIHDGGQKAEVSAAVPRNRMELISSRFEKYLYPKDFFGLPSDAVIEELYFYFINADGSIVVKDDENGGQEFFVEQSDE